MPGIQAQANVLRRRNATWLFVTRISRRSERVNHLTQRLEDASRLVVSGEEVVECHRSARRLALVQHIRAAFCAIHAGNL